MPAEDKYGQQLQQWFQNHATDEPKSVQDAVNGVGCSRQRVYQWLQMGATDVIEVSRNSRGAGLFLYRQGARRRLSVGPRLIGGPVDGAAATTCDTTMLDVTPGATLTCVSTRRLIGGHGEVELEDAVTGQRFLVSV